MTAKKKNSVVKDVIGREEELEALNLAVDNNLTTLLVGETGVGKTYMLYKIAQERGKKVVRMSLNGQVGVNELLGRWLINDGSTYWSDGVLIDAMRNGHWIILDEINSAEPEVLMCLNSLLDDGKSIVLSEKDGEAVKVNPNCRIFATMNPSDEYVGTKDINKALLSRFNIVLNVKNYDAKTELDILQFHSSINDTVGRIIVDTANAIRKLKAERHIWYTCSTRDIIGWAKLCAENEAKFIDGFKLAVLNKAFTDDEEMILKVAKELTKDLEFKWTAKADTIDRNLTDDIKVSITELENRRSELSSSISDLETKVSELKTKALK